MSVHVTIASDGHSLTLVGSDTSHQFNRFWLRDQCPTLPTKASGLRTFSVATLPDDLRIEDATVATGTLVVDWSDQYRSTFDLDELQSLASSAAGQVPPLAPPRTFDAGFTPARFVASKLVPGSETHHELLDAVVTDGFVLVHDMADTDSATSDLAALLGQIRHTDFGRVFDIVTEPEAWTLSQSSSGQDPHTDDPFRYTPSGISILHCRQAAVGEGGRSMIVDGFRVAEDLRSEDPAAFELLRSIAIPYVRHRTEAVDQGDDVHMIAHAPVISVVADQVTGIRFHERSTGVFALDPAIVDRYYLAFRAFATKVRAADYQYAHKLAPGEAFVFDNQRVLHGRTGWHADTSGRRHIRLCTVDRDQVHSRLRRLREVHDLAGAHVTLASGAISR